MPKVSQTGGAAARAVHTCPYRLRRSPRRRCWIQGHFGRRVPKEGNHRVRHVVLGVALREREPRTHVVAVGQLPTAVPR